MAHETKNINVFLLSQSSMLREGLRHILAQTRFHICVEQDDQNIGSNLSDEEPPLFIVDASYEDNRPAGRIRLLREQYPTAKIIVLVSHFDVRDMLAAIDAGANGYCLATINSETLSKSLEMVMLGETVFPASLFLSKLQTSSAASETPFIKLSEPEETGIFNQQTRTLSSREAEILRCLMQGAPNKVIARELNVAEATVKVHVKAILRKIRVSNRTQAAIWAAKNLMASNTGEYATPMH